LTRRTPEEGHRGVQRQVMVFPLGAALPLVLLGIAAVPVVGDDLEGTVGGEPGHECLRRVVERDVGGPELGAAERP
jgi:hypothetical protein